MARCDMCGSESQLFKTLIEGTDLSVCEKCSNHGKILERVKTVEEIKEIKREEKRIETLPEREMIMSIVDNYSKLIKDNREKLNLKQEDFAKDINEKHNLIHNIETGRVEPSIALARKLERFFKIKLIEEQEVVHEKIKGTKSDSFTVGDFIKIKNK